jgi:hypothetical protein
MNDSKSINFMVEENDHATRIINITTKRSFSPIINGQFKCCSYFTEYGLPCSHILILNRRSNNMIKLILEQTNKRWFRVDSIDIHQNINDKPNFRHINPLTGADTQIARFAMLRSNADSLFNDAS